MGLQWLAITYLADGIGGLWVGRWQIEYSVQYGPCESDGGRRIWDTEMLATAFGVKFSKQYARTYIARKVGASYGKQGQFVLLRHHLNVPMPGTGNDGDPNVSVHLSDEIQEAVASLIADCS